MNRKKFITSLSVASVGAAVFPFSTLQPSRSQSRVLEGFFKDEPPIIKPPRLKNGDKLALVAPGSYIAQSELQDSIKNLADLGFGTTYSEKILLQSGYFAGTDENRAKDLMEKFSDKNVKGIVCARGGYGCTRILPLLDYDVIRANPKVLIGYSDITALLYGLYQKAGLVSFHGPVGTSTFNDYSINNFKKILMDPEGISTFSNSTSGDDENIYGVTSIVKGKAKGRLVGGNLSIIVSLIGTEFDVDYSNKIIFIEEIGEEPYRIDRMLTQMMQAGKFEKASGVMLGLFRKCEVKQNSDLTAKSFNLMEVLKDRFGKLKIPVVYGMSFGHVKDKFTIPFGALAELDAGKQTFTLLEKAVN
ncbi:MAG: LD-carboxypeptidase [Ignavibacteriaceae bacterium]|nr:LD-carboxypeptidase [Ignavibacterium sp.]MCC6254010.1 LD-carboxypeptidase [Ignavibacteriaceae bacterium]HRN25061.1 LD-carboxypeptidase [Ignavibacteriaceae bacterium]HRQ52908.1 LD-carboxypeptidase [Ignavibacteriaceae bacterium]